MTCWLQRRRILRCVAGELDLPREQRLRRHLAGCTRCRQLYDDTTRAAEALGVAAGPRRARARLLEALGAPPPAPPRVIRWWAPALAATAAAVLLVAVVRRPPSVEITLRGGADEGEGTVHLLLHASRRGEAGPGPLRLVADLPGAGEARLSLGDYLQLGYAGLTAPAYVTVVGVDERGEVHVYLPRPGAGPLRAAPADGARALGPSIDLGRRHQPGRLRLYALFSRAPLELPRASAAAARAGLDGRRVDAGAGVLAQVTGLVTVEP